MSSLFTQADTGFDWVIFARAGRDRLPGAGRYEGPIGMTFRYSPFVAMWFALITPLGYLGPGQRRTSQRC